MDSEDDYDDENMEFSYDQDFEGGQWIQGEFYYKAQKRGRTQTEDERLYGAFAEGPESSDDDGNLNKKGKRKHTKSSSSNKGQTRQISKSVGFVPSAKKDEARDHLDEADGQKQENIDGSLEADFEGILKAAVPKKSLSNEYFSKVVAETIPEEKKKVLPVAPIKDLGAWEKHTKGIGLKLLQKFGFKGRLGANEDGVSRAIEVVVRPGAQGLGFGDFTEASSLAANKKIEAEWRGKEYNEKEARTSKGGGAGSKKSEVEIFTEIKSWQKGGKKQKARVLTASEILQQHEKEDSVGTKKHVTIIDMRYSDIGVVTDAGSLGAGVETNIPAASEKPKLGQELLYNISLVANLLDAEVAKDSRKFNSLQNQLKTVQSDIETVTLQQQQDSPRLDSLTSINKVLDRIEDKLSALKDDPSAISIDAICKLFATLHKSFPREFHLFGLIELLPAVSEQVVAAQLEGWAPLNDPGRHAIIFSSWEPLSEYFRGADEVGLMGQLDSMLGYMASKLVLPPVRRAVTNEWSAFAPHGCVMLVEGLRAVLSAKQFEELVTMVLMPKITAAVAAWSPSTPLAVPIHEWLHPWLPLLGSRLSSVYPDIRRKMGSALLSWHPCDDSARQMVLPWLTVFDPASMENFLLRSVVPKLLIAMYEVTVNPQCQDISQFEAVMRWSGIIPREHFVALFLGEFFHKWLAVLATWLCARGDLEEIRTWYLGWRSMFPTDLLGEREFIYPWNMALDMMAEAMDKEAQALQGRGMEPGQLTWSSPQELLQAVGCGSDRPRSYYQIIEKKKLERNARIRLEELNKPSISRNFTGGATVGVSFKDLVGSFAASSGLLFAPKPGNRMVEGNKLWLFGSVTCYIDQNVVYAQLPGAPSFAPIALDDLLKVAQ